MKEYEGKSIRNVKTATGALPSNVGFPKTMEGVIRKLTKAEIKAQKAYLASFKK